MTVIDGAYVVADGQARVGTVLVEGRRVAAVAWGAGERADLCGRGEVVRADGHYLMPGMVDAHAHLYAGVLRGTENSLPLELWALFTTLYGRAYTAATVRAAVLLGAAERIRAGITATLDHSPMLGLAEAALAAHEESGLRVAFAPMLHDRSDYDLLDMPLPDPLAALVGGPPPLDAGRFAGQFGELVAAARAGSGRVQVQLGPNAPQRCSPEAWALWRALRDRHDVGVHTHLLETRAQASLNARYEGGLVAAMAREGMLEGVLTCAHGVWLSEAEMEVLARHDVTLSHNPASNLMLGSGVLRLGACRACGLRVGLGNDSTNTAGRADHFAAMRLAMMLQRPGADFRGWPTHASVLEAATADGAGALGLAGKLGRIAPGQLADLVLVRADAPGLLAAEASVAALVQHAGPEHVVSVMVDGVWVLRDGLLLAFDEAAALRDAGEEAREVRARVAGVLEVLRASMPAMVASFLRSCG